MASRLFDEQAMTHPNFSNLIRGAMGVGGFRMNVVGGPGVHAIPRDSSAVNPAWRTAYAHVSTYTPPSHQLSQTLIETVTATAWNPFTDAATIQQNIDFLTHNLTGALEKLAPNSGSYVNEVSLTWSLRQLLI
jgi:hypothetical protein